jgi:glycosyltransferase involved in cell wall biosynthesis
MKPYSVVITTFDKRFEAFLVPLIASIRRFRPKAEIVVMVNGPCNAPFDQTFRAKILKYLADHSDVYPTIFPNFQSLSKLWNRGILAASHDSSLVLNDDLVIHEQFFDLFEAALDNSTSSFRINESFSHYLIYKTELIKVGFFDERLLGLGEEDGDFFWRYHECLKMDMPSIPIPGIDNVQSSLADPGYIKGIRTASKFNRDFILKEKYQRTLFGHKGMFDYRVRKSMSDLTQYPYEEFYLMNKHKV